MATLTLTFTHRVGGVLTDATSAVLSDPTGTFGVQRTDTSATVVTDGTAMTHASTGVYSYSFTEPATDLTYDYFVEWVYGGITNYAEFTATGASSGPTATLTRVKEYLGITDTASDTKLTNLLAVASAAVEDYCDRKLVSATRTEYHNSAGRSSLALRAFPVTSSPRVRYADTALCVTNTSSTNQTATVSVDSGVMTLTRVASGTSTASTRTLSSYATLDLLAAAITALGNGWSASVYGSYSGYPTSTIRDTQGTLDAKNDTAEVEHFVDLGGSLRCNTETGTLWLPWRLCDGVHDLRIDYAGGYADLPEPVIQATCAVVAALYRMSTSDQTLTGEKLGDYSWTSSGVSAADLPSLSPDAAMLLAAYKRPRIL